jgi:hypothetical protein
MLLVFVWWMFVRMLSANTKTLLDTEQQKDLKEVLKEMACIKNM